jgi:hypothetical protein
MLVWRVIVIDAYRRLSQFFATVTTSPGGYNYKYYVINGEIPVMPKMSRNH